MPRESQWRTAVWYGDLPLSISFPPEWEVAFLWPHTPSPLTEDQIAGIVNRPAEYAPIRHLCRGKKRPLVIVDDPNRATPVSKVMPFVLQQFLEAGIPASSVRILVATGTHGVAQNQTVAQKVGPVAASQCQVLIHDSTSPDLVPIGKTSFGTPVRVNREVVNSDFMLGIGGVYPNHTAGFGGGAKLALGVLGFASIKHLHYRHQALGWGSTDTAASFRQDVNEIARMIALSTMISVQVDAQRQIVRMVYGDPARYFDDEVDFSRRTFAAPLPGDADVVLCNTYPNDLSLTFALMKGITPLYHCRPGASRIAVAFCGEGVGRHGLFPLQRRFQRARHIVRRVRTMTYEDLGRKVRSKLHRSVAKQPVSSSLTAAHPIWLYRPGAHSEALPRQIRDVRTTTSWPEVLEAVRKEQPSGKQLRVVVYPCAPLQSLEPQQSDAFAPQSIAILEKKSA